MLPAVGISIDDGKGWVEKFVVISGKTAFRFAFDWLGKQNQKKANLMQEYLLTLYPHEECIQM